jgi:hypothetical protein
MIYKRQNQDSLQRNSRISLGGFMGASFGKSTSCLVSLWEEPEKQKRIEDHYKSRFGKINNVG